MPNAIAFFPWIREDREIVIGDIRLLPYRRGKLPGGQPGVSQADLDAILGAYANRKDQPIEHATLLELGGWHLGADPNDWLDSLFRARDFIAFAALAARRLFRGHFDYCNAHCYALVVQNYDPGNPGTFSFTTRRRDGTNQYLWGTDDFAFYRPLHVNGNARLKVDQSVLLALQAADRTGRLPHDAIVEFSAANTDSPDTPLHTEIVMTKSAFEFLFDIGHDAKEFTDAVCSVVPACHPQPELEGPLAKTWLEKRPKATRPLDAWAREFCDLRGGAAHGKDRRGDRFVWSPYAHLAFASLLFPLLVKHRLASEGFLDLNERDAIELPMIEGYLSHDPFAPLPDGQHQRDHPWERVYGVGVLGEVTRRNLESELARIDWSHVPADEAAPEGPVPNEEPP